MSLRTRVLIRSAMLAIVISHLDRKGTRERSFLPALIVRTFADSFSLRLPNSVMQSLAVMLVGWARIVRGCSGVSKVIGAGVDKRDFLLDVKRAPRTITAQHLLSLSLVQPNAVDIGQVIEPSGPIGQHRHPLAAWVRTGVAVATEHMILDVVLPAGHVGVLAVLASSEAAGTQSRSHNIIAEGGYRALQWRMVGVHLDVLRPDVLILVPLYAQKAKLGEVTRAYSPVFPTVIHVRPPFMLIAHCTLC